MKKWFWMLMAITALGIFGCTKKQELHVYTWCDYISPEVVAAFEKKFNCQVYIDIFDSNEMMFSKLQAGSTGYDIVVPSHYFIRKMADEKLIVKLDKSRLPNLKNLDDSMLVGMPNGVQEYAVPYFLSYTGIGYNKQKVTNFEPSWNMFKRADMKGYMTLLDDYSEVIGAAMLTCGYKTADLVDKERGAQCREEVKKLALEWRQNVSKFENEQYKNGLSAGEFLLVMGYSMDLGQVASEDPEKIAFAMPREGCLISCDMLAIPAKAASPDLAYEFINFVHEPEQAARNIRDVQANCPNRGAYGLLGDDYRLNPSLCIPTEVIERGEYVVEPTPEQEKLFSELWNEIRGGE